MDKEFQEIKAATEKVKQQLEKLQADFPVNPSQPEDSKYNDMYNCMNNMARNIYASIDYLHNRMDKMQQTHADYVANHGKGHIPSLTPSQMEKHLKNIGAEGDYNVVRPNILMAKSNKGITIQAEYKKS